VLKHAAWKRQCLRCLRAVCYYEAALVLPKYFFQSVSAHLRTLLHQAGGREEKTPTTEAEWDTTAGQRRAARVGVVEALGW
jgi:hypothetical protein